MAPSVAPNSCHWRSVRPTIFACALALERNPAVTSEFVQHGYDIVSHGYRWINHLGFTEAQTRADTQGA